MVKVDEDYYAVLCRNLMYLLQEVPLLLILLISVLVANLEFEPNLTLSMEPILVPSRNHSVRELEIVQIVA
jgi:hypothetical protein